MKRLKIWTEFTYYFLHSIRIRRPWCFSPLTWIKLYLRGFLPLQFDLYNLREKRDWRIHLNQRQILATRYIDGIYGELLDNKLLSSYLLEGMASIPRILAVILDNQIYLPGQGRTKDLKSIIRDNGRVILKPVDKNGGKGIYLLEYSDGVYLKNRQVIAEQECKDLISPGGQFLLSEYVQQGSYARSLYPDTVNTIRVITMLDPDLSRPFIAGAVQRAGTSNSFPVDNVSSGGLACRIDIVSGRLGKASRIFMDRNLNWIEEHPESGVRFEEMVIPGWDEICAQVIELSAHLPLTPYIAWDIALLDDGICVIESNSWSDLMAYEIEEPLKKIRKYSGSSNIITWCKKKEMPE